MLIAQCNGCRIMKPSLFTVVPFKLVARTRFTHVLSCVVVILGLRKMDTIQLSSQRRRQQ